MKTTGAVLSALFKLLVVLAFLMQILINHQQHLFNESQLLFNRQTVQRFEHVENMLKSQLDFNDHVTQAIQTEMQRNSR